MSSEKRALDSDRVGSSKRQHTDTPEFDWKLTLSTPQTFKTLLSIVEPTVTNVPFQVCMEDEEGDGAGFTGLRMDAMNSSKVCMVKTAYRCQVEVSTVLRNPSFCVKTDLLKSMLRDVDASHVVEIIRYSGSDKLAILGYSANSNDMSDSELCMLHDDTDIHLLDMFNLTFNYVIEIELDRLKKVCHIASSINSSVVEFSVGTPLGKESDHYFTIRAEGEGCTVSKVYHGQASCPEGTEQRLSVGSSDRTRDQVGRHELVSQFKGAFPTVYLSGVLKSMERQTIQLYMSPGMPLVLHYGLGDEMSYIKIVLAPRVSD